MARQTRKPFESWIVLVEMKVIKELYCDNCSEADARSNPLGRATDEQELDVIDYRVISVMANK